MCVRIINKQIKFPKLESHIMANIYTCLCLHLILDRVKDFNEKYILYISDIMATVFTCITLLVCWQILENAMFN